MCSCVRTNQLHISRLLQTCIVLIVLSVSPFWKTQFFLSNYGIGARSFHYRREAVVCTELEMDQIVCQATGFFPSIRFFWVSLSTPLRYTISELTTYNEIKLMSLIF